MASTREQLDAFIQFSHEQLHDGESDYSLLDLFDLWQEKQCEPDGHAENVTAIRTAIDEFKSGERGRPAGELTAELRIRSRSVFS